MADLPKGSSKLLNAWAFYDWANSVYPLVISSAVFPIFYKTIMPEGVDTLNVFGTQVKDTALISFVTAAAFLVVAFISPLLSGIADYVGNKKNFMRFFNYLGALSCMGLFWFDVENIYLGLLFYFFGLIGFWGSLVFYNSYLPDIAFPEQQDRVSARGYSMGYVGSVILLIVNLVMIMGAESKVEAITAMKLSFIMVGIWWILFSQYTYYYLPKGNRNADKVTRAVLFNGFRELKKVWGMLSGNVPLKRYLSGFFVYSMAVQTVMLVATYFGESEIDWESEDQSRTGLIICILLIQLVAVLGAVLTSRASAKFGNIPTLIVINMFWLSLCAGAWFVTAPVEFYVLAALVGLVMGGIQSLSRSTYSKLLPETQDTASFFSFYDVSEKIGIVIGMFVYGLIDQMAGPRYSIMFLALFFLVGILLLRRVPKSSWRIGDNG